MPTKTRIYRLSPLERRHLDEAIARMVAAGWLYRATLRPGPAITRRPGSA